MELCDKFANELIGWLSNNYFNKNFGSVSKADFETFLFSIYYKQKTANGTNNAIDCDDYSIGRELGLTIARVRSLKERMELKHSSLGEDAWKDEFVSCMNHAHYDKTKDLIKVLIPDVNVIKDLRHFCEVHGWYDEYQLNTKLFQCNPDTFVKICEVIDGENNPIPVESISALKEQFTNENETTVIGLFKAKDYKGTFKELGKIAGSELANVITDIVPFGDVGKRLFAAAVNIAKESIS